MTIKEQFQKMKENWLIVLSAAGGFLIVYQPAGD